MSISRQQQVSFPLFTKKMLEKTSKLVARRSTPIDGQLFLIKHLPILREHVIFLDPYLCFFSATRKELDLSHSLTYDGMIIGEHTRDAYLDVNPVRSTELTTI